MATSQLFSFPPPGRLLHHLEEVTGLSLRAVQYAVLDEADRLFEMGFAEQVCWLGGCKLIDKKTEHGAGQFRGWLLRAYAFWLMHMWSPIPCAPTHECMHTGMSAHTHALVHESMHVLARSTDLRDHQQNGGGLPDAAVQRNPASLVQKCTYTHAHGMCTQICNILSKAGQVRQALPYSGTLPYLCRNAIIHTPSHAARARTDPRDPQQNGGGPPNASVQRHPAPQPG